MPRPTQPQLSKQLGTRHRAAIGITEDTDAIAVVVSEETGAISLVEDGNVSAGLDGDELRARLKAAMGRAEPPSPEEERDSRCQAFVAAYTRAVGKPDRIFGISALTGEGCPPLVYAIMEHLESSGREAAALPSSQAESGE